MIWEKRNKLSNHELCGKQSGSMINNNWIWDGILPAGAGFDDVGPLCTCLVQKEESPLSFVSVRDFSQLFPQTTTMIRRQWVVFRSNLVVVASAAFYNKIATSFSLSSSNDCPRPNSILVIGKTKSDGRCMAWSTVHQCWRLQFAYK